MIVDIKEQRKTDLLKLLLKLKVDSANRFFLAGSTIDIATLDRMMRNAQIGFGKPDTLIMSQASLDHLMKALK
jgi:hypothetical protein